MTSASPKPRMSDDKLQVQVWPNLRARKRSKPNSNRRKKRASQISWLNINPNQPNLPCKIQWGPSQDHWECLVGRGQDYWVRMPIACPTRRSGGSWRQGSSYTPLQAAPANSTHIWHLLWVYYVVSLFFIVFFFKIWIYLKLNIFQNLSFFRISTFTNLNFSKILNSFKIEYFSNLVF
jgi:hypothetical protein